MMNFDQCYIENLADDMDSINNQLIAKSSSLISKSKDCQIQVHITLQIQNCI